MDHDDTKEQSIQWAMTDLDGFCRGNLMQVARRMVGETPPYPPAHLMTLARFVFVLAYRVFSTGLHPDAAPGWSRYEGKGADSHRFLAYVEAVIRLNETIDAAARAGKIRLNDRATGVALTDWKMPDKDLAEKFKASLLWAKNDRVAAEALVAWPIWYPHMYLHIVVEPNSFVAWLENEGIAAPGETMLLIEALKNAAWATRAYAGLPKEIHPLQLATGADTIGSTPLATSTFVDVKKAGTPHLIVPTEQRRPSISAQRVMRDEARTVHKMKSRIRLLDAEIAIARAGAGTSDQHAVWTALTEMAIEGTPPFTGQVDASEGIAYNKDGEVVFFTKDALRQRLRKLVDNGQ